MLTALRQGWLKLWGSTYRPNAKNFYVHDTPAALNKGKRWLAIECRKCSKCITIKNEVEVAPMMASHECEVFPQTNYIPAEKWLREHGESHESV